MGGTRLDGAERSEDPSPVGREPTCDTTESNMACEEGFEPPSGGLEMPRPILTGSHMCFRLAVAILVVLGLTGRLDANTAYILGQVVLP
jgi:hypothetical protein